MVEGVKAGLSSVKGESHGSRWAISMFPEDNLRESFLICFWIIDFVSVDEHDDIRVLFDGTGFTEITELRAFVGSIFEASIQLRQCDDGNVELFCEPLSDFARFH